MRRKTNHQNKNKNKKKTKFKKDKENENNGKSPGTGFPSLLGPLSRYNALPTELRGTCHGRKTNLKNI